MLVYGQAQVAPRACREEQDNYDASNAAQQSVEAGQHRRKCNTPDPQQQQHQLMQYLRRILPLRNSAPIECSRSDDVSRAD